MPVAAVVADAAQKHESGPCRTRTAFLCEKGAMKRDRSIFPTLMSLLGRLAATALASHPCPPSRGGLAMNIIATCSRQPWNKGKLVGQKPPLRLRDIWAIRVRLQIAERTRDLALFDLAIDSKLRACDLTKLRARDVADGEHVSSRAMVMQQKTQRPVQFEITEQTRSASHGLDTSSPAPQRGLPFPEPAAYLRPSIHSAIRSYRHRLGESHWP